MVLEKTLESPLDCKEIKTIKLKEISPEYSLEGLMLKLKLQYFGHLMQRADSLEKPYDAGKDQGQEKGQQTLGHNEGQGSPVCCSPWGHKESDMTEQQQQHA